MESHEQIATLLASVWQQKDFNLLRTILEDRVAWQEGPYNEPLSTPDEVIDQWKKDLKPQNNIKVKVDGIAVDKNEGYYHFKASWDDIERGRVEIDGVFCVMLGESQKIARFNQWYSIRPE